MPTALPNIDSPLVKYIANEDPNYLSAYNVCLDHEEKLAAYENKLRYVRILGFLLLYAPNRAVRHEVVKCIHSRRNESDLTDVGQFFECYLIMPFKKYKGRTPKPSEHPSRPSFEGVKNQIKVDISVAPKNHHDAKRKALIRDNWRCIVTGLIDLDAPEDNIAPFEQSSPGIYTECAHIIPEATFFGLVPKSGENSKLDFSATILAVLQRFHYDITKFNGEKVHSLTNVITLEQNIHDRFDRLELYFEATSQKDHYEVKFYGRVPPNFQQFVTFSTRDPEHLPVPSPELLSLHATCCKVAKLSGSAEYIDRVYRDADEMDVLAPDGASGDVLSYLLSSLSNYSVGVRG
ncbi:hypothetical protein F5148DRAFT_1380312 [Russula earlei]|uniref:Uncharacterized protein n=1 Tax=Russula earlei TaxID=71964 RepID=A0ACC0TSA9_9AGAM|nr:hypothetical protein F5148DRAFT_1380312 [Russula earlei]